MRLTLHAPKLVALSLQAEALSVEEVLLRVSGLTPRRGKEASGYSRSHKRFHCGKYQCDKMQDGELNASPMIGTKELTMIGTKELIIW